MCVCVRVHYLDHVHVHPVHLQPLGFIQVVDFSLSWCLASAGAKNGGGGREGGGGGGEKCWKDQRANCNKRLRWVLQNFTFTSQDAALFLQMSICISKRFAVIYSQWNAHLHSFHALNMANSTSSVCSGTKRNSVTRSRVCSSGSQSPSSARE